MNFFYSYEEAIKEYLPVYHDLSKKDIAEKSALSTQLQSTKCFVTQQVQLIVLFLGKFPFPMFV